MRGWPVAQNCSLEFAGDITEELKKVWLEIIIFELLHPSITIVSLKGEGGKKNR